MPISELTAIERIARVLAGQRLSINAEGQHESVSVEVDAEWFEYRADAVAVLKTLREPDIVMANAGDPEIWSKMVEAALDDYGTGRRPDAD
jgi:environmental stress-induced protein Ves